MKRYSNKEKFIFIGSCFSIVFFLLIFIITAYYNHIGLCFLMLLFLIFSLIVFIDYLKIFYKIKLNYPQKFKQLNYLTGLSIKELRIYNSFNLFINRYNDFLIAKYKYDVSVDYYNIHNSRIFKNNDTLLFLMNQKNTEYNNMKNCEREINLKAFEDEFDLNNYPLLESKYNHLKIMCEKNVSNDIPKSIRLFFKGFPMIGIKNDTIIFMSSGILIINYNLVKLYDYKDLKVEFNYDLFKSSYFNSSYSLDHITYLHTTVRGTRDKRYNYNPSFYLYKMGIITLNFKNKTYKLENNIFNNAQYLYQSLFNFINDILSVPNKNEIEFTKINKMKKENKSKNSKNETNYIVKDDILVKITSPFSNNIIEIGGNGVKKIGKGCFSKYTSNINEITLHNDIIEIQDQAFKSCNNLNYVNLSNNLTYIGASAFEDCMNLKEIIFTDKIIDIQYKTFFNCSKLEKIFFGENIKKIGLLAFDNCQPKVVFFNGKINNIGDYGIETNSIKRIYLGKNIKIINKYLNNLEEINFISPITGEIYKPNIEDIRYNSFSGSFIKKIPYLPNLKYIGMNSFKDCSMLEEITISKNVEVIGTSAFENCTKLKKLVFESGDKELKILDYAFKNCSNLSEIIINRPVSLIGSCAFKNCSNINKVYINNSSENPLIIESEAFNNCSALEEIKIYSISRICSNVFLDCRNLKNIYLHKNIELVETSFAGCNNIEQINIFGVNEFDIDLDFIIKFFRFTRYINNLIGENDCLKKDGNLYLSTIDSDEYIIPDDVHTIKSNCFNNNKIKKIIVKNNIKKIENYAFNSLNDLSEIFIDSSIEEFEGKIFNKCNNLVVKCYRGSPISKYCQYHNYNRDYLNIKKNNYENISNTIIESNHSNSIITNNLINNKDLDHIIKNKNTSSSNKLDYPSNIYCENSVLINIIYPFQNNNIEIGGHGITKIGKDSFARNSENINEIIIHDDIIEIHDNAFKNCKNLHKILLSNNLNYIGSNVFEECINLKEISIPNNIKEIQYRTFHNCEKLEKIYFGDNIELISTFAFINCFPKELFINGKIKNIDDYKIETSMVKKLFLSDAIEVINKNFNNIEEIKFINPISGKKYDSNIIDIYNDSFCGSLIKYVPTMPKLKIIGMRSFKNCAKLEEFIISKEVEIISNSAFENCSNLKKIIFESSDKELKISECAFKNCSNLTEIIIDRQSISIGENAFENCSNLKKVVVKNKDYIHIGENAFKNCISLIELELGDNLKIENNSFDGSDNIEKINIYELNNIVDKLDFMLRYFKNTRYINNLLDKDKTIKKDGILYLSKLDCNEYIVPNDIHTIKSNCFNGNKINKIIIDKNVKKIEKNAFNILINLSEVSVLSNTIKLEGNIFYQCGNFVIKCFKNTSISKYCDSYNYKKQFITIEKPKEKINQYNNIDTLFTQKDNNSIINTSILSDKTTTSEIKESIINNKSFLSKNILYKNNVLVKIISPFSSNSIEIGGSGINIIGIDAFAKNASNITEIIMHNDVVGILDGAFKNCTNLEKINLSNNLETLGSHSFENCENLRQIVIPNKVKYINYSTFSNCKRLKKIYFGDNIEAIASHSFINCFPTEIYYNGKINNIVKYNIDTILVKKLYLGDNIEIIDNRFKNVEEIYFKNPITGLNNTNNIAIIKCDAFNGSLIKELPIMPKLKCIEMRAFENCSLLNEITISNSVELIGASSFENCSNLSKIIFESGDKELKIENNAFKNCINLKEIIIDRPITIIGYNSFENCTSLRKLQIENNYEVNLQINVNAFKNCSSLEQIKIHSNVKIWSNAFSNCVNLKEIYLDKDFELVETSFSNCPNIEIMDFSKCNEKNIDLDFVMKFFRYTKFIENLLGEDGCLKKDGFLYLLKHDCDEYIVPDDIHTIKSNCFYGNNIKKIVINNNVKNIEDYAFNFLNNLEEIFIDSSIENFGKNIIINCNNFIVKCHRGSPISKYCQLNNYKKEYLTVGEDYNSKEIIHKLLLDNDTVNINYIDEKYRSQPIFRKILEELCANYDIIEFEKENYINFKKLSNFNITKKDIYNYCNKIINLSKNEYFTIDYMEKFQLDDKMISLGFDNVFYISLLRYFKNINSLEYNNNYIFKFGSKKRLSISDFIKELIEKNNFIDTEKLHEIIENDYKIKINKKDLKVFVKNTNIYYNETMDTFYKDYDTFINEI